MRIPLIVGNWKMNLTGAEVKTLLTELKSVLDNSASVDIGVCPSFPFLSLASDILVGTNIKLGAQNMSWEVSGAFTGEVSPVQLRDAGCSFVILGHSERRHIFNESNDCINKKVKRALEESLNVILCVGETLKERENGSTEQVVKTQLEGGLKDVNVEDVDNITIAYEPVWAIGTGKTATPAMAQEVHAFIRNWLGSAYGRSAADEMRIQYGGSMKPENCEALLQQSDIDGGLIGGASLHAGKFSQIISTASGINEE